MLRGISCLFLAVMAVRPAAAELILFSDNFNVDSSGSWNVNHAPLADSGAQSAEFAYDYSAFGIPAAPGSTDTLGLRLRANIPGGAASPVTTRPLGTISGLSLSPTGQDFGSSYQVTFYAWANYIGSPNASGIGDPTNSEGGTANLMFALGTSGTAPLVVGNSGLVTDGQMDGIGFATTGDGGLLNDYRVYPQSGTFSPADSGVYAANATANTDPFYENLFPSVAAPAVQQTLATAEYGDDAFNTQAGSSLAGSFGFAWHKVVLTKNGSTMTWDIDDTRIVTFDTTGLTLGGNNIALGQSDVNASTARHPSLVFSVFDNLTVTTPVPEPSSTALILALACAGFVIAHRRLRARRRSAGRDGLQPSHF